MRPSSKADAELYNTVQQRPLMEHRRLKLYLQIVYPQLSHLWKPYCSKINADTALQHTTTVLGLFSSRTQVASDSALEKYFFFVFAILLFVLNVLMGCCWLWESADISDDFSFLVFFPNHRVTIFRVTGKSFGLY